MSDQARMWVSDKSKLRGIKFFVFYMLADQVNYKGEGTFSAGSHLAWMCRMSERSIRRILHAIERSGELVCVTRGTGHTYTMWRIPGVVSDGYDKPSRGDNLTPLRGQVDPPERTTCPPRVVNRSPNPSTGTSTSVERIKTNSTPTPPSPPVLVVSSIFPDEKQLKDFREWLDEACPSLDDMGQDRLILRCKEMAPWCDLMMICRAVKYKLHSANGARNKAGLLIATVPALLKAWGPVGAP